jgi:hypothetical protein
VERKEITMEGKYEVLSPWAEVDPVSLRGISPRLSGLAGKTIGIYNNPKRASRPMLEVVKRKLKEKYPDIEFSHYYIAVNDCVADTEYKDEWEEWLKGVDAVVLSYGD